MAEGEGRLLYIAFHPAQLARQATTSRLCRPAPLSRDIAVHIRLPHRWLDHKFTASRSLTLGIDTETLWNGSTEQLRVRTELVSGTLPETVLLYKYHTDRANRIL